VIVLCDGVEIGYDDVGTGMPVAFIHGFPHNRTLWAPQVSALVDRARCIALDLRGFGESSRNGPFTIDQFADDLAMLLRTLGIERAVVAGLSMGGYIAFAFWRRPQDASNVRSIYPNGYVPEEQPTIKPYDENGWAQLHDAKTGPIEMSLALLDAVHDRWVRLLRALSDDQFGRVFIHPEHGPRTVDWLVFLYAWHGRHHTAHITELRKQRSW